ncbi:MAG TPA: TfpX/TfpZ family type IV pilin accessory protein [Burkholderiaceae bacterium]|nr:TfpX/TfpZ family type IV pilin accessory protein [Burkholderiaceae bacterium]
MKIRHAVDSDLATPLDGDTLPMVTPPPIAPAHPVRAATPAPGVVATARDPLRDRARAAGVHLLLSGAVAAAVFALVHLLWYPAPLSRLLGVDAILAIVLLVDVVLGPLFTLIVFDRRKKRLAWDLATIAALQLAALGYGVWTIGQGRPAFVVLVKDRFELVAPADLRAEDRAAARGNPWADPDPLRPRWVAARLPDSARERSAILVEAIGQGRDVQHHPRLYVDHAAESRAALERALPIARLRALNPARGREIDAAVASTGLGPEALRYLPLRGTAADGAVLVDATDGRVRAVTALAPW